MNRTTLVLVGLFVVAGAAAYFMMPSVPEREYSTAPPSIKLVQDSAAITKVEIRRPSQTVSIENEGGTWTITSPGRYGADPSMVQQLIGRASRFRMGNLISSNPDKQSVFEVDSSNGTVLSFTDRSGKTSSIVVGKSGPSYTESYVRFPESKDVYLAEGLDNWSLKKELKDWRNHTIAEIPGESVQHITYTVADNRYEFVRDTTGWTSNGQGVGNDLMTSALNAFRNIRADDFVDTVATIKTQPVRIDIDNLTLTLHPVPPDTARYYAQTSRSPQMYTVSKWSVQQMLKPLDAHGGLGKVAGTTMRKSK
jgi:hypothetical protein